MKSTFWQPCASPLVLQITLKLSLTRSKADSPSCILLVKLKPSLFDHLTRTAMKNLDRELNPQESAAWSELKRMKQIQTPRNLCDMKYLPQNQFTSPLAVC